jgi:hypothetical protein
MKRALVGIVAACSVAFAGVAMASVPCPNNGGSGNLANVKIGLHAQAYNSSKACSANAPSQLACDSPNNTSDLTVEWPLNDGNPGVNRASVYIVALDVPTAIGLKGVTFGLDFSYNTSTYEGIYIQTFNNCMDLAFASTTPAFPADPGSGVVVTSSTCLGTVADPSDPQGEALVVIGWLDATGYYVATPLQVTPRLYLATPDFQTADCTAASSNPCYPEFAGICVFGGAPNTGYSPCVNVVATEPTTWSRLKQMGSGE